jgi:uncharacterized cupredoxin-like copper-binding protein
VISVQLIINRHKEFNMHYPRWRAALAGSLILLAACGGESDTQTASGQPVPSRTIEVAMTDMAFAPGALDLTAGETVAFRFRNDGAVAHEAVVGDVAAQEQHHADMTSGATHTMDGDMAHGGGMHGVVVQPGETVELTHTFDAVGVQIIGCHQPGHWEAGMKIDLRVVELGAVSS